MTNIKHTVSRLLHNALLISKKYEVDELKRVWIKIDHTALSDEASALLLQLEADGDLEYLAYPINKGKYYLSFNGPYSFVVERMH